MNGGNFTYQDIRSRIWHCSWWTDQEEDNIKQFHSVQGVNTPQPKPQVQLHLSPYCRDPEQAMKDVLDLGLEGVRSPFGNWDEHDLRIAALALTGS